MSVLAKFEGYILREIEPRDREQVEAWLAADEEHREMFGPEFFMGQTKDGAADPRASIYVLEDKHRTLMFIRLSRAARVHIQFPPEDETPRKTQRRRTSTALLKGMAFLEVHLARAAAEEWIFNSESGPLRQMATSRLGFHVSRNELVRQIALPVEQQREEAS
jgi:hypothetical protein